MGLGTRLYSEISSSYCILRGRIKGTAMKSRIATESPMGLWDSLCILYLSGQKRISWDVPNHPTQIPTVHPIPMTHGQMRRRNGMGWTVGIKAPGVGWLGTSQAVPSCPDGTSGWDGQLGSRPLEVGWLGTSQAVPSRPNGTSDRPLDGMA